MRHKLKIVFMGTAGFALPSLKILIENGFNIIAVVTAPDKPAGRGLKLQMSPVKKYAVENNIPVLQPEKLKTPEFIGQLKSFNADLQVVVAFRMLPQIIWSMPPLGTINVHASLLPDYRGAAPINWAIIRGEKETGVTTFFLQQEIDTGDIIHSVKIKIEDEDDAGTLHDKLMNAGANLLLTSVSSIEGGTYKKIPQTRTSEKKAPKIFHKDCMIDWETDVVTVKNFIRGLSPYPGAYSYLDGKLIKIFNVAIEKINHGEKAGKLFTDNISWLKFSAENGFVFVLELQREGKKKMRVDEFLRGYKLK